MSLLILETFHAQTKSTLKKFINRIKLKNRRKKETKVWYLNLVDEAEEIWHVDEHVIISLEDEIGLVTVAIDPLHGRHGF